MPMYQYVKSYPRIVKRYPPVISFMLLAAGLTILVWVAGPMVTFWAFTAPLLTKAVSPVPESTVLPGFVEPNVLSATSKQEGSLDYTNPNVWYPAKPQKKSVDRITTYTITIPKLKIIDANVIVAGDDLAKSLIHYGGTALPGEYGNTVIFGHSTLVQFYNPKDYTTIFSTLPTLKTGDSIYVKSDGVQYRYVVYDMTVTQPEDLTPLEGRFDNVYLTLITCVPPGTYLKRLNVKAKLESYDE